MTVPVVFLFHYLNQQHVIFSLLNTMLSLVVLFPGVGFGWQGRWRGVRPERGQADGRRGPRGGAHGGDGRHRAPAAAFRHRAAGPVSQTQGI